MCSRVFLNLLCAVQLLLFSSFFSINQAVALDFEVHKFKQCVYTAEKCECCQKVDIIDKTYNGYARDSKLYISENTSENEIIFLRYSTSKRVEKKGYLTFVLQKSRESGEWREVLSGRSMGIISRAYFGQYVGAFCLQRNPTEGQLFVQSGDRYLHQKNILDVMCVNDPFRSVKMLFDPR